jgi:hypothetical protein
MRLLASIVQYAESKKINLNEISLDEFKKFSRKISKDVYDAIDIEKSIRSKKAIGSTSPANVKKQAKKILGIYEAIMDMSKLQRHYHSHIHNCFVCSNNIISNKKYPLLKNL